MSLPIVLSAAYWPTVSYLKAIVSNDCFLIEAYEHFQKQTFRNRAVILTASGPFPLTIPVKKVPNHTAMKEVQIDYTAPWQRTHWRTIEAAYNNSPYFLYYQDFISPFYEKKFNYLLDYNIEILETLLKLLKVNKEVVQSEQYTNNLPLEQDYRDRIQPKTLQYLPEERSYPQVFAEEGQFYPYLSCLDKLFNVGHLQIIL